MKPGPGWRAGFRALRTRNYRLFWVGQTLSQVGSWMQATAQGWLVLQLTDSPFEVGLVTALQFTPALLLALVGGAIADRVDRHRMLFITQTCAAIQALAYAVLVGSGQVQIHAVFAIAFGLGLVNAFDTPLRQSFVSSLVPREDLPNAVSMNALIISVARVLGPTLAGLLIASVGMAAVFWANFASYMAILAALALMRRSEMAPLSAEPRKSIGAGIGDALRVVRDRPGVVLPLILMGFVGTFGYNFNTFIPLIGGFILKVDPVQYGGLAGAQGVGAMIGALSVGYLGAPTPRRLFLATLAFGLFLALTGWVPIYAVTAGLLGCLGVAMVFFTTSANASVQLGVPDEFRGRAMSLYWMLFAGSTPVGALFVGWSSSRFGVMATLQICAAMCGVGALVAGAYWAKHGSTSPRRTD